MTRRVCPVGHQALRSQIRAKAFEVGKSGGDAGFLFAVAVQTCANKQNPLLLLQGKRTGTISRRTACWRLMQESNPGILRKSILAEPLKCGSELPSTSAVFDQVSQTPAAIAQRRRICVARPAVSGLCADGVRRRWRKQAAKLIPVLCVAFGNLQSQDHPGDKWSDILT